MIPLFLGMTFDARNSRPGVDIFDMAHVNDPVVTEFKQTKTSYKIVTSSSEAKDVLDVQGDLSLKIKNGMIDIAGKGAYLKEKVDYSKTVEILTVCEYISSTKAFKADAKPRDNWPKLHSPEVLGTHYVSSITYGAEMIASLRFKAFNSSDLSSIKGAVNAVFGSGGSGNQVTAEGKMEKLEKDVHNKANLEISYYGTVPLKSIPNDINGFRTLVNSFKEQVDETNLSEGIPMKVNLLPLTDIVDPAEEDKFKYIQNQNMQNALSDFEMQYDELRRARLNLTTWSKSLPPVLKPEFEKQIASLWSKITSVIGIFGEVIAAIDMSKGPEQLKPAQDAYNFDGNDVYNRYEKMVRRLIQRLNPLIKRGEVASDTYIQWGNNNCTGQKTVVLYEGFVISSSEEGIGGTAQYECAPKSPQKGYDLSEKHRRSHLAGIRYTKLEKKANPFKGNQAKKISEKGVSCAKCYSPESAAVVMFAAVSECPLTWSAMYSGYLMSARSGGHTTQYICVDDNPSAPYNMEPEEKSKDTLALTVIQSSGALPSETYTPGALIRCIVCSMQSNQIVY
ncbi:uncharacterized protein TNIN_360521 [Trichonephila inaurata madagascariensis]|uniref:MACPF domain-containing protein n=1 Tax=Trichonephila inaurata madagascariensis TaxID=2747483 RepID=A0A8X7C937_9ARAC|nr:uncharacterized protein TNIN_360521 [Trichonephila inaurata madagascariensis]